MSNWRETIADSDWLDWVIVAMIRMDGNWKVAKDEDGLLRE